jgi:YVTN family beta-propeller protein
MIQIFNRKNKVTSAAVLGVVSCFLFSSCFKKVDDINHTTPAFNMILTPTEGVKNTIVNIGGPGNGATQSDFPDKSSIVVKINNIVQPIIYSTANQIQVKVLPGTGTGPVEVTIGGTTTNVGTFTYDYTTYSITSLNDGSYGDVDGPIETAGFDDLRGLAIDGTDKMYSGRIYTPILRQIDLANDLVSFVAGSGVSGNLDGVGNAAKLGNAFSVGVSLDGSKVYWADRPDSSIRVIDVATKTVSHLTGRVGFRPEGITVAPSGNIYITGYKGTTATTATSYIQKYNSSGVLQWSVKAKNTPTLIESDGDTSTAAFYIRSGITVNKAETMLYFGSDENLSSPTAAAVPMAIKSLDLTTGMISTLIANDASNNGYPDNVFGIAVDNTGGLWLADWGEGTVDYYRNGLLRVIVHYDSVDMDGDQNTATAIDPWGVVITSNGDIVYTDDADGFNKIKRIHPID